MNLKKKDKRLIFHFCNSSRSSYAALGRKSRMSQQLVHYKINSFLEAGIIGPPYSIVDYSRFGLLNFKVHFRVNYRTKKTLKELIEWMSGHDNVMETAERDGNYDLIVSFAADNPSSFNKQLKETIEENPDQLKNHMILTNVVSHYFPLKYLVSGQANDEDMVIGGDRKRTELRQKEMRVLGMLVQNPRVPSVRIASQLGLNPRTVVSIIKKLQKKRIIRRFSSDLRMKESGFLRHKMMIRYHNLSVESENRLVNFCMSSPNVVEIHKLFGDYDLEITVEAGKPNEIRELFVKIRENFEDIIQNSNTFQVYRLHKRSFLPAWVFKKEE